MHITYTNHIKHRLLLRGIDEALPGRIFAEADEHFADAETGYRVAVMTAELYGKMREIMVAYVIDNNMARLLTIHPLKAGQKENRLASGRWRRL